MDIDNFAFAVRGRLDDEVAVADELSKALDGSVRHKPRTFKYRLHLVEVKKNDLHDISSPDFWRSCPLLVEAVPLDTGIDEAAQLATARLIADALRTVGFETWLLANFEASFRTQSSRGAGADD